MSDLGPEARALIAASRGEDEPSADDRARVGRKLAEQLPAFAASAGLAKLELGVAHAAEQGKAAASTSGLLGSGLAKIATLSVAAVLAGSAAIVLVRDRERPEVQAPAAEAASPAPLAIAPSAPPPPSVVPSAVVEVAPRPAERRERTGAVRPLRRAAHAERGVPQRQPVLASATSAESAKRAPIEPAHEENLDVDDAFEPSASPPIDARVREVPVQPKVAAAAPPRTAPVKRGPDPEAVLLAAARGAFEQGDPERALELTQRHAARFPRSTLAEERVALQGLVLCALHRIDEGLSVLRAARAADSPLHAAALRACKGARSKD